jgi:hypothetical protein
MAFLFWYPDVVMAKKKKKKEVTVQCIILADPKF